MVEAVIFDLDGTLLDTLGDLRDSVNATLEKFGYPPCTTGQVRQYVGNGVAQLMALALPGGRENPDFPAALDAFRDYYAAHSQVLTAPYPGIGQLLEELEARGIGIAVVSNKFDGAVKTLCRHYFGGQIPVAIGEREAQGVRKKPAPDTVLQAARELGVSLENCVYVGDSDVDIATAQNAGIGCISVTWGFRDKEFLEAHGATVYAETPNEILNLIGG